METAFQTATLPLGLPELTRWKVLLADLKSKNRTLSCEDTLIAATALHHGCQVVTLNQRHFLPTGVKVLTPV